jgi:3-oxoacyl-[acyl-carrier protein] reductase
MPLMEVKSVAVITGASQGIGRATASRLARDFSAVVLVARDKQNLETAALEITALGAQAMVVAIDLRLPQSAETVVKDTLDRFGRIDALVNIADAVPQIDWFQLTDAQWDDGMALQFHGARRSTLRAWEALNASKGSVVFMSGNAARDPKPGNAAAAAINAAIIALAKAFAEQGIKDGVQVNSTSPGAMMTGRRQAIIKKWAPAHSLAAHETIKKFPEQAGINRFGKPEEVAELMNYKVSPAAKWMARASVRMDGGEIKGI